MKNSLTLILIASVLALTSCQPKQVTLTNVSPNKQVNITVKAQHKAALDPWTVELDVKAYSFKEGHLKFELQANDITDQSVKFNWQDDKTCLITFDQADGKPRLFKLLADSNQVQMGEVNL
jgi:hypothetical protein